MVFIGVLNKTIFPNNPKTLVFERKRSLILVSKFNATVPWRSQPVSSHERLSCISFKLIVSQTA
jgi:hypothetical protein